MAFVDCTEQQIPRPVDKNRKKMYYSGKKKRHTAVKNQLMVNNQGYIIHKANHKKGRRHDYNVYKKKLPYKKKRNQESSQEEKEYNKIHSKKRIVIEHTICRLKKYRIISDIFRNKLRKYQIKCQI